jgi:hypothetical protein
MCVIIASRSAFSQIHQKFSGERRARRRKKLLDLFGKLEWDMVFDQEALRSRG